MIPDNGKPAATKRRQNMNLSHSELNYGHDSTSFNEDREMVRLEPSARKQKTLLKRLIPGSWHGEKGSVHKSDISKDSESSLSQSESDSLRKSRTFLPQSESGSLRKSRTFLPLSESGSLRKSRTFLPQSESDSLRKSRTSDLPVPEPESPGSSHTIRRILSPNILSPSTPSQPKSLTNLKIGASPVQTLTSPTDSCVKRRAPNLLDKISTGKNLIQEVAVPSIYKYARKCMWEDFANCLETATARDIGYVYKKDGTTVMHMVVMSRTGYINAFKSSSKDFEVAPLELLEKLLQMDPEVAKVKCCLNGYTPLTYACLVCNNKYDVESAATMVRLFLKYCPESVHMFTKDGLSPVDIHVVSYSHHHPEKEDLSGPGRSSASVLRTLLTHSPELACNRLYGDKIKGPIELLYKCNSKAFSQAALDEIYDGADEDGTVKSDFTIPERRQKVVDTVKKWWIWTWTVMILKYGSLKQKKRGAQFAAVHAAAMQVACPTPLLTITLYAFPRQIKQPILDKEDLENLPLHAVCSWPSGPSNKSATQSLVATRKSQAISRVIQEYPLSIKVTNGHGETALELAAKTGTTWDGGVRRLVKAYPKALRSQSKRTGLYPFMTAAAAAEPSSSPEREAQSVRTIYGLLRSNPKVLTHALQNAEQQ